jgi:hypothetical protein|tara:strand:- start:9 stop:431 length:423 start_codon:yes stop_codon:yes gene_type:complete
MTKNFDDLNETFNVSDDIVKAEVVKKELDTIKSNSDDVKKDYEYTRGNLYSIIEKGQEALNGVLELAQESEQPRAYEVAGQLIKSVSDATDKLMDLQKKLKDVEEEKQSKGPSTVNNALFVGSTAELAKMLKHGLKEDNK